MDEFQIKRLEAMKEMQLDARKILDKYSYQELMLASDENEGPPELLKCLRDVFLSIIEDWIQDYINEREDRFLRENSDIKEISLN